MNKSLQLLLMLSFLIGLTLPGLAADEKNYRFELFGGLNSPIDKDFQVGYPQTSHPIIGSEKFTAGPRAGVRIGMDKRRHWGQDYTYSYAINDTFISTGVGRFPFTSHFHEASSNVLFYPANFENRKINFFLTAGLGAMWSVVNIDARQAAIDPAQAGLGSLKNEVKFSFNAGAGVRFRLTNRYGVRLDVRDYISSPLRYGLPASSSDPNAIVFPVEHPLHQLFGSFSFVIHF